MVILPPLLKCVGERDPQWVPYGHQLNEKLINIRRGEGGGVGKGGPLWSPAVVRLETVARR